MIKKEFKIFRLIKNPKKIIRPLGDRGFFKWMSDKSYLELVYYGEIGKKLNLQKPQTFNEKLQWLKLNDRKEQYSTYVDKYSVREHIKRTIGEEYLIPMIDVYENVEDIRWNKLPNSFVLKCTHGSNCNIICTNKEKLDIDVSSRKLKKWMKKSWYWLGREWPYKNVKPRIICEKFISDNNNTPDDYKVLCFNGKAKLIEVHIDRFSNHVQDIYDIEWNKTNITQGATSDYVYDKPKHFDEMIELSEKLAKGIRHVRIDWFVVKDKLYFGEITFYDGSGFAKFDDERNDYLLGSWIDLEEE